MNKYTPEEENQKEQFIKTVLEYKDFGSIWRFRKNGSVLFDTTYGQAAEIAKKAFPEKFSRGSNSEKYYKAIKCYEEMFYRYKSELVARIKDLRKK